MDFKARFAGKTSKITKEGNLDANKAGFDHPLNQPGPPARAGSINKNERSAAASGTGSHLNITRNSRFSYKGSE
jgi:hypothetical protein